MASEEAGSELTLTFLANFSRLKRLMDGCEPCTLKLAASLDDILDGASKELWWSAFVINMIEEEWCVNEIGPIDTILFQEIQNYEVKWKEFVDQAVRWSFDLDLDIKSNQSPDEYSDVQRKDNDLDWQKQNSKAKAMVGSIEAAIKYGAAEKKHAMLKVSELVHSSMCDANEKWEKIQTDYHINLLGMLRRRNLLARTLVTQRVQDGARPEMLENFAEARIAFVGGATKAAFSMLRSVWEICLRDFMPYSRPEDSLPALVSNAGKLLGLPSQCNIAALQLTQVDGNAALQEANHGWPQKLNSESLIIDIEIEFVRHYKFIQALVEHIGVQENQN